MAVIAGWLSALGCRLAALVSATIFISFLVDIVFVAVSLFLPHFWPGELAPTINKCAHNFTDNVARTHTHITHTFTHTTSEIYRSDRMCVSLVTYRYR